MKGGKETDREREEKERGRKTEEKGKGEKFKIISFMKTRNPE